MFLSFLVTLVQDQQNRAFITNEGPENDLPKGGGKMVFGCLWQIWIWTGLQKEEKLHYNAVSEICDLRHRLKVALEQESKHLRMVETFQSERELWLRRCLDFCHVIFCFPHIFHPPNMENLLGGCVTSSW